MNRHLKLAMKVGALAGARSMSAPLFALRYKKAGSQWGRLAMTAISMAEMFADKMPAMPSRLDRLPLSGRMLTGSLSAAYLAPRKNWLSMAVVGALAAVASSVVAYHLRQVATGKLRVPNVLAGLFEDSLVARSIARA